MDGCQIGQGTVSSIIHRVAVIHELDDDLILTENINQPAKRCGGISACQPLTYTAFSTAGEDRPVFARARGEVVQIVDRSPLLAAAQLGPGDSTGQPVIALQTASEHEKVLTDRIGNAVLRPGQPQRQFGTEDRLHLGAADVGCLGETGGTVETVMVGD